MLRTLAFALLLASTLGAESQSGSVQDEVKSVSQEAHTKSTASIAESHKRHTADAPEHEKSHDKQHTSKYASAEKDAATEVGSVGAGQGHDYMHHMHDYMGYSGDWEKYIKGGGSGYQKYMEGGNWEKYNGFIKDMDVGVVTQGSGFQQYTQQYAEDYSPGNMMPKSAKGYMAATPTATVMAASTGHETGHQKGEHMTHEQKLDEAQKAMDKVTKRAQEDYDHLRAFADSIYLYTASSTVAEAHAQHVARAVQAKVQEEFRKQHREAEASFQEKLHAVAHAQTEDDAIKAATDAQDAKAALRKIDSAEMRTMRHAYDALKHEAVHQARPLHSKVMAALRDVNDAARELEHAQKKAGVHESVYEKQASRAEHAREDLERSAESLAEHAQGKVEHQFDMVEHILERSMDDLDRQADKEAEDRSEAIYRARAQQREAMVAAKEQALAKAAKEAQEKPKKEEPKKEEPNKHKAPRGHATKLVAEPASQASAVETAESAEAKKEDPLQEAEKARDEAARRTKTHIADLRAYADKLKHDLHDHILAKRRAGKIADGIQKKVQADFSNRIEKAQKDFGDKLRAMEHAKTEDEAKNTNEAATRAYEESRKLYTAKAHAMLQAFDTLQAAEKSQARDLQLKVKQSTREMTEAAHKVEQAQRKAGEHEQVFERQMDDAENSGERIAQEAESVSEHAQGMVESKFGLVEGVLRSAVEAMEEKAQKEQEHMSQALLEGRVRQAASIKAHAQDQQAALTDKASPQLRAGSASKQAAPVVLAASKEALAAYGPVLAGCALVASFVATVITIVRRRSRTVDLMQVPMLG